MKGMMVQRRAMLQVWLQLLWWLLEEEVVFGVPFVSRMVADVAGIFGMVVGGVAVGEVGVLVDWRFTR